MYVILFIRIILIIRGAPGEAQGGNRKDPDHAQDAPRKRGTRGGTTTDGDAGTDGRTDERRTTDGGGGGPEGRRQRHRQPPAPHGAQRTSQQTTPRNSLDII